MVGSVADVTTNVLAAPVETLVGARSSMNSATRFMTARALSLTVSGFCCSAKLTDESALALLAAVRDQA
jgi:hypothetical protein